MGQSAPPHIVALQHGQVQHLNPCGENLQAMEQVTSTESNAQGLMAFLSGTAIASALVYMTRKIRESRRERRLSEQFLRHRAQGMTRSNKTIMHVSRHVSDLPSFPSAAYASLYGQPYTPSYTPSHTPPYSPIYTALSSPYGTAVPQVASPCSYSIPPATAAPLQTIYVCPGGAPPTSSAATNTCEGICPTAASPSQAGCWH